MSHPLALRASVLVLYGVSFFTSLVGNIMALHIIRKLRPSRGSQNDAARKQVAILFANMIVADLLVTLVAMPEGAAYYFRDNKWPAGIEGDILCRFVQFCFPLAITASIFTLGAMTLDKFVKIVYWAHPRQSNVRCNTYAILIWSCSILLMSHRLLVYTSVSGNCEVNWSLFDTSRSTGQLISNIIYITILFVAPLVLIAILSSIMYFKLSHPNDANRDSESAIETRRGHRNTIKLLIAVVIVFTLCWLPVQIMHFRWALGEDTPPFVMFLCFWCGHSYSAINPWIYICLQPSFRQEFFKCFSRKKPWTSARERTRALLADAESAL